MDIIFLELHIESFFSFHYSGLVKSQCVLYVIQISCAPGSGICCPCLESIYFWLKMCQHSKEFSFRWSFVFQSRISTKTVVQ